MDAFYASVEQRDNPALRGQAAGGGRRARIAAVSWRRRATKRGRSASARRCRWRSAVRRCPSLVIVRPDFARYKAASSAVFAIFREVTPLVEPLSLDEAYLDVTENAWGEALGNAVAKRLKQRDPDGNGPDGLGGRRAQQVPREDRLGLEEAGRPHRDQPGSRRAVPSAAAGRRALGRRGRSPRRSSARAASTSSWTCGPPTCSCCATPWAASPTGFVSSPMETTIGRSFPIARRSRPGPRTPTRKI